MGLLENAAEWLESQRIRELSVPIVYQRRGGETLNIPATPGRTLFRSENEYGVTIRTETRDFLIAAEELETISGALRDSGDVEKYHVCKTCAAWLEENTGRKIE